MVRVAQFTHVGESEMREDGDMALQSAIPPTIEACNAYLATIAAPGGVVYLFQALVLIFRAGVTTHVVFIL